MANKKNKNVDISENLFQATDILIKKQLEGLSFDKTIEATITDTTRASEGIYTVSTGNASFLAYADKDNYKKDEEVMVTIPQGDYDKQKTIISRKIDFDQTEKPENYNSAFSTLIDIVNNNNEKINYGIKVNKTGEEYSWDTNIANFINSNAFTREGKNARLIKIDNKNLKDVFGENELVGYTRLGVKADFTSFLDSYNVVSGNYGLTFLIKFKHNETDEEILRQCFFDSKDFFGDVYNFIIPQTQEIVFDISEYAENYHIEYIEVYLYQRDNFINTNGQLIDTSGENNDIVLNSLYLTLGIDASEYVKDTAKIYTLDRNTYQKNIENSFENNKKTIKLNWIHKNDITGNISRIQNDIPENYEIRWYYYKLGSSSADNFSGASWERFYGCTEIQDKDGYYCRTSEDDIATNQIQVDFYPNVGKDTQQLKVIIIKKNIIESFTDEEVPLEEKIAESKIITFTNLNEKNFDSAKIDLNDLSIRFEDESFGNYFLYNRAGQISKGSDSRLRTLTAVFDEEEHIIKNKKVLSLPYGSVKWTVPASNTMIRPVSTSDGTGEVLKKPNKKETVILKNCKGYYIQYNALTDTFEYILNDDGENPEGYLKTISYYISNDFKNNYNRNYVQLEVQKNGSTYITKVNMNFGPSGTSGSKYKITIDWDNYKDVFNINNENEEISGHVVLTQDNKTVDLEGESYYSFRWYPVKSKKVEDSSNNDEKFAHVKEKNKNLYYPITSTNFQYLLISYYDLKNDSMSPMSSTSSYCGYGYKQNVIESSKIFNNYYYYPKYWIHGEHGEYIQENDKTVPLAIYDLKEKKYKEVKSMDNLQNKVIYGKVRSGDPDQYETTYKYKFVFKKFDKVKNVEYQRGSNTYSGVAVFEKDGTATYYYDSIRRAYVKYNDEYIVDPWADFDPEREYYYPIYADINYESNLLLDIQDQNENNIKKKGYFKIVHKKDDSVTMNDLYILEVTLNNFGDYNLVASFPIALKQDNDNYNVNFINGPTQVIYSTTGEISFDSNDPYSIDLSILDNNGNFKNISSRLKSSDDDIDFMTMGHWELIIDTKNKKDIKSSFLPQLITLATPNLETTKALLLSQLKSQDEQELYKILLFLIQYKNEKDYNIIIENINDLTNYFNSFWIQRVLNDNNWNNFSPINDSKLALETYINSASEEEIKKFVEQLKKYPKFYSGYSPFYLYGAPYLNPPGVYFKDTSFYGVKYVLDHNIGKDNDNNIIIDKDDSPLEENKILIPKNTVLWTQPIIVEQDNYFSTTLNNWNGKDIITDEQTGIISANGFSAGRKEEDNTFTGVVLGDWSKDISSFNPKYTGIFGFDHNIMSYALKDDGTAFFGKDGRGRIYFDGNSARIYSDQWTLPTIQTDGTYKWQEKGMMLDVDDGILQIKSPDEKIDYTFIADSKKPNFLIKYNDYDGEYDYEKTLASENIKIKYVSVYKDSHFYYELTITYSDNTKIKQEWQSINNGIYKYPLMDFKQNNNNKNLEIEIKDSCLQINIKKKEDNTIEEIYRNKNSDNKKGVIKTDNETIQINCKSNTEIEITTSVLNLKYHNTLKFSSTTPYLSIGSTERTLKYGSEYGFISNSSGYGLYAPSKSVSWESDFIRINKTGGWLVSSNYMPTLCSWLTDSTSTIYNKLDTKASSDDLSEDNPIHIYPDNMYNSTYHCWGADYKTPFTGLVIDLTHGKIVLGNDSEIKGYGSGRRYRPAPEGIQGIERVFHISNGLTTKFHRDSSIAGLITSEDFSDDGHSAYFILAENILPQTEDPSNNNPEYSTIFRVGWDGAVYCKSLYIQEGTEWKQKF